MPLTVKFPEFFLSAAQQLQGEGESGVWMPLQWENPKEAVHVPTVPGDQRVLWAYKDQKSISQLFQGNWTAILQAQKLNFWDVWMLMLIIKV